MQQQQMLHLVCQLAEKLGAELQQSISWQSTRGCGDGNNLAAAGLPNIDTMGVQGGKLHSADEYFIIDSLVERSKLTTALLAHLAQHQLN